METKQKKLIKRKVRKGKAKDYRRNAKYYNYYYIIFNKKSYCLNLNGWNYPENLNITNGTVTVNNKEILLIY